jgi:type IVB pilus formation R64 PilN family outer membrane protein
MFMAVPMVIAASGCGNLPAKVTNRVAETQAVGNVLVQEVGQVQAKTKAASSIVHENGFWLGANATRVAVKNTLPAIFYEPTTFDRTVHSLDEFAERVTMRSGLPTKVTPDAQMAAARVLVPGGGASAGAAPAGGAPATLPGSRPLGAQSRMAVPSLGAALPTPLGQSAGSAGHFSDVRITYPEGNLKGLLDTAAARFGVFWKYANGSVLFYHTETRTFQISAIPGDSALSASVASSSDSQGGAGGAGGGGSGAKGNSATNSQNTEVKSELSVFGSLEKSIGSMLSTYGKVVSSPATGSITVTDTPDRLDQIATFVDEENKALSRQIMVNVSVLSVEMEEGDNYGINWNAVYNNLTTKFGISNTFAPAAGSTSFSAAILDTSSSKFAGTAAMISALSSQGQVRQKTTASVATLNNQPVPVQVAKQTTYLKSSETTVTANVGSSTTLTPGVVTSGFNLTVLPHVLHNGTVMLQFSTDISSLKNIRTVSSNNSTIESPETTTRNFLQRVAMKSGETLIISGFEQLEDRMDAQGVGRPTNYALGGGYRAGSTKEVIVILITPITINGA